MNRTVFNFTLVLISTAAFGLAACSGASDPTPAATTSSAPVPVTSEPADVETAEEEAVVEETPAVDMSLTSACMSLSEPLQDANVAMLKIAETTATDAQSAVDTWRAFSVAFEDFGNSSANPEVASLSAAVGANGHALTDVLQKLYVEEDLDAMGDFTEANDAFFKAYRELLNLCNTAG